MKRAPMDFDILIPVEKRTENLFGNDFGLECIELCFESELYVKILRLYMFHP
jgi:hypothetical protein